MPNTEACFVLDGTPVTLHFDHWLPRLFGGLNNCITLSGHAIYISRDWVTAKGLSHEVGHVYQARARGWWYLPWVLWCYRVGYRNSVAEVEADAYMNAHWREFQAIGPVPAWVAVDA